MTKTNNKNLKLIIFDMDGTILDTLDDITNSVNYTFNKYNLPEVSNTAVRAALGNGAHRLIGDLLRDHDLENLDEITNFYIDYYSNNSNIYTKPYDGIIDLLKDLKEDYELAVVSNKSNHLVKSLNNELFFGLFDLSIGELEDIKKKPDPAMIRIALEHFDVSTDEAIFIGDSEVDIETGRNAKLEVIAVSYGFRDKDFLVNHNPDHIAETALDIRNIIKMVSERTS